MAFHEDQIVLRFPVMSDLHIMGEGQETSKKLDHAFSYLKSTYGEMDAVFFPGDLTDFGLPEQMEEFKKIMCRHFDLNRTKLLLAIGNHELYRHEILKAPLTVGQDFVRVFEGKVFEGAKTSEIQAGNHKALIHGYPFIMVNAYRYSGGVDFRPEDKEWLKEALTWAEKETEGKKPIFVCAHPMIVNTCYGSNYAGGDGGYWSSSQLYPILAEHPSVIYFSGHLHFPLQHKNDIWQKEFTAIGTSSAYFVSLEAEDPEQLEIPFADIAVGSEPANDHAFSQGLLVEVDKENQTRITRIDFYREKTILSPWLLPAPDQKKSQLKPYAKEARALDRPAPPKFPKDAKLLESKKELNQPLQDYEISFTAAVSDEMIESYRLSFVDDQDGSVLKTVGLYSDFFFASQKEEMAKELHKPLTLSKLKPFTPYGEGSYHLELQALDFDHQRSETICSPSIARLPEGEDSLLNCSKTMRFGSFLRFNDQPLGKVLKDGTDFSCWPPLDRGDAAASPLTITSNGTDRVLTMHLRSGCYQFDQISRPLPADATGADQVWLWLDCTDVSFSRLYFTFISHGEEYSTDACNGRDMKAYIKERGVWKAVPFSYDGCLENFGDFRGTLRFPVCYLQNSAGEPMPLDEITAFRIGFSADDSVAGKDISFGDVKFSKEKRSE